MKSEAQFIESDDFFAPIERAIERIRAAKHAWAVLNSDSREGECVRPDIVRAIRAGTLFNADKSLALMAFGVGGPNPCRSNPVELPTWETFARSR